MAHVDRKQYMKIFGALVVLTALEVGIVYVPGIAKPLMALALIGMAVTKAAMVGIFFMHLGHETKTLKTTVFVPFIGLTVYALVLITEAGWRLIWPATS